MPGPRSIGKWTSSDGDAAACVAPEQGATSCCRGGSALTGGHGCGKEPSIAAGLCMATMAALASWTCLLEACVKESHEIRYSETSPPDHTARTLSSWSSASSR